MNKKGLNEITFFCYLEGKAAEGDYLVEEDPVAPHVGHRGEEAVSQALRGHPPHRQHAWQPKNI
jgi:hypothetical protein